MRDASPTNYQPLPLPAAIFIDRCEDLGDYVERYGDVPPRGTEVSWQSAWCTGCVCEWIVLWTRPLQHGNAIPFPTTSHHHTRLTH